MIIKVFTIQENICQYLPYNNELIKNQFNILKFKVNFYNKLIVKMIITYNNVISPSSNIEF